MRNPRFDVEITPFRVGGMWAGVDVRYRAEVPTVAAGDPLLRLPKVVASIPGAPYTTDDIVVADASGPLTLTETEGTSDPMSTYRRWTADRSTAGPIEVAVHAPVRAVDVRTPVGPLLDLRREDLGLFGAGITILPLPLSDDLDFDFSLSWHLDAGVSAVSSRGTGDEVRTWTGDVDTIARCLLGAGTPATEPGDSTTFGIHAYSEVPFDLAGLSSYLRDIHTHMSAFFEEDDPQYHVLVRRNPDKGSGGTSFHSSFAFGYSPTSPVDEPRLRSLLAHEMVHNWPRLDEDWAVGSWYSEGAAEFYSLVLPLRAGILTPEECAAQLGEMYRRYDANPRRFLSYDEAAGQFWADMRVQTLPYGRGIKYLVHVDTQLRSASAGRTSLDDVVLDILRAQRGGEKVLVEGWLERIETVIGDDARADYEAMVAGRDLPPPTEPFQGVVRPVAVTAPEHDLGFDVASFNADPRVVTGLVSGCAAQKAGLADGDELLTRRVSYGAVKDGSTPLELAVRRDGRDLTIRYEPRGADVSTTDWVVIGDDDS